MALIQTDIKRMLAYSSVDEIGYILVGLGLGTFAGLNGAIFDIFNHAIMKGMLFLCAGTLIFRTGKRSIAEMGGLSRRMPITAVAFMIGSLGMAGVPPLNGFYSKYIIYKAAFDAGYPTVTILLIIASAIALGYYLKAMHAIFFGETREAFKNVREAPISMTIPLIILSILCLLVGIVPQTPLTIVEFAVKALVGG
jgi:formate hydrogenlyase subunit 3/multisubunit Na+/H+ antiporter MnhD subunit